MEKDRQTENKQDGGQLWVRHHSQTHDCAFAYTCMLKMDFFTRHSSQITPMKICKYLLIIIWFVRLVKFQHSTVMQTWVFFLLFFVFLSESSLMAEVLTEMISCVIRNAIWSGAQASLNAIGALTRSHDLPVCPSWCAVLVANGSCHTLLQRIALPEGSLLPQRCPGCYVPPGR